MNNKTTVVIPCYNCESVIGQTLESLFNQTEAPDQIVLVDDGSIDNTLEALKQYVDRVQIIKQPNSGAAVARHNGTLKAENDIIIYMDAGDIAPPNKVKVLKQALIDNPDCICSFGGYWNKARARPETSHFDQLPFNGSYTIIDDPFASMLERSFPFSLAMNIAARKKPAIEAQIGNKYIAGNDHAFQLSLARFGKFVYASALTVEFEVFEHGLSATHGINKQMAYSIFAVEEFYKKHPNRSAYKKLYKKRISYYWPKIAMFLHITKKRELLPKIIKLGLIEGSPLLSIRAFIWNLQKAKDQSALDNNPFLRFLASII